MLCEPFQGNGSGDERPRLRHSQIKKFPGSASSQTVMSAKPNGASGNPKSKIRSSSRNDAHDLEPITRRQLPVCELGRRDCVTVVLDYDASRQQLLADEESLQGARQLG